MHRGIAYVPQGRIVFKAMSVVENLEMGAYTVKDKAQVRRTMERVFAFFPRLGERRNQKAGTMSGGEQQMLAMGRALMVEPRLVLLDEPSLGLAPLFVEMVFDKLRELNASGMTLLLVEQNAASRSRSAIAATSSSSAATASPAAASTSSPTNVSAACTSVAEARTAPRGPAVIAGAVVAGVVVAPGRLIGAVYSGTKTRPKTGLVNSVARQSMMISSQYCPPIQWLWRRRPTSRNPAFSYARRPARLNA